MSKTIIEVKCIDQVLSFVNTPVIASGGVGEDYVSWAFCEKWDDCVITAVFWRQGVDPIPVLLDAENTCQVPPELMTSEGVVYFGAYGVTPDGIRRTTEGLSYRISAGVIDENTELPEPDGDIFDQLLAQYADVKVYVSSRIDEAADAAVQAGENAQAAEDAAAQAERHAKDAVDAVDGVIYPGIVQATLNDGNNAMVVPLSICPPDKMILTFQAPFDNVGFGVMYVSYPDADGKETRELFIIEDGYQKQSPSKAVGPGDIVTVLLTRPDGRTPRCYPLNSRITKTTLDEMNQRLYPGIPASTTVDGTMTIALDYVPEDKMVLVFAADEASSQVTKFQLEYETEEDGLAQFEYSLVDAKDSPVESYGFYAGDYVVCLLTPADNRATVLNPRVTRDTMDLIRGVFDNSPEATGGTEVISYVGDGTSSLRLVFSKSPKIIQVESMGAGGYTVSALLVRDTLTAKVRVFSDGNYSESIVNFAGSVVWNDMNVILYFSSHALQASQLNVNNTNYIAIGIM